MGATLDALHVLQEIELKIADIRRGIDRKHQAAQRQKSKIAELDSRIRAEQDLLRQLQVESDRVQLDVQTNEAEIAKLRLALNQAKTNKEYSAILTQLNTTKADNSKIEEKALTMMSQVDAKRNAIAALRDEREKEAMKLTELLAAASEAEERNQAQLSRLGAERDAASANVPVSARDCFNRVAKKNDGEALAKVVRTNPKRNEFACEGCNMSLTLEQVNMIMSRDEAVLCNTCGRILYMPSAALTGSR